MASKLDLWLAPREELIALIELQQRQIRDLQALVRDLMTGLEAERARHASVEAKQQEEIDRLTQRVRELEQKQGPGGPPGGAMPGTKPTETPAADAAPERPERKRRTQGFGWRAPEPTESVDHAVENCRSCGMALFGGSVKRRRLVVDLPEVRPTVTEHRYWERRCPCCGTRQTPGPELAGVVAGEQRFGVRLVSMITVLREELRVPYQQIRRWLRLVYGLTVSVGAIVSATQRLAERGSAQMTAIADQVRGSPVVHLDETGWRENGRNRYLWIATSTSAMSIQVGNRAKGMVRLLLGDQFAGVLVSDFYAAYHHYAGVKQRCWAHLLRDIHALCVANPDDPSVQRWAASVHAVYHDAVSEPSATTGHERAIQRRHFENRLLLVCQPFWDELDDREAAVPQRTLCLRIASHIDELFVFVEFPEVPPDNNAAERGLRHTVVSRKVSGGTRSEKGTDTKTTLATLFGTWRLQQRNPLGACLLLLGNSTVL